MNVVVNISYWLVLVDHNVASIGSLLVHILEMNLIDFHVNKMGDLFLRSIVHFVFMIMEQVQEKKIKKLSEMNVDPSKAMGNGCVASSSNSNNPKEYIANGGSLDNSCNHISDGFTFPSGGISSLRFPVVLISHSISISFFILFVC